ncbi:uncharacterized protein [Amphiura filiformis]|uniref:uncharacterized protein n=1 Tax=Amphiura filiformis TaxID=82378 RepID=UPI003B21E73B
MAAISGIPPTTEELLFKLAQEFVICPICRKRFQEPKSLACSHTFCKGCLLIKISPRARHISCPSCRRPTSMPSKGISGLIDNQAMNQLLQETQLHKQELFAITESDWPICGMCGAAKERRASNRCIDCKQFLCKACYTTHMQYNVGALQGHTIVSLDDIQHGSGNGSIPAGSVFQTKGRVVTECLQHPGESAHFYCETCAQHICRDCTVINHTKPEHTYTESRDAAGKRRKTIRLKLTELRDSAERLRRISTQTGSTYKEARKQCESIKEQIKRRADEEVARIREAESRLLKEIDEYESSVLGGAPSVGESELEQDQHEVESLMQVLHQITEEARDDSFLTLYPALKDKMTSLCDKCAKLEAKPLPTRDQVPSTLHFEPHPKPNVSFELGVVTQRTQVSTWNLVGKFGREGQGKGELRFAKGIATTADGLIAVADDTNRRVTVYGRDGHYQFSLVAESRRYGNLMHVPSDVAVSSTGHFIVVDRTGFIKIFDRRGQFLNEFSVLDKHRSSNKRLSRSLRGTFGRSSKGGRKRDVDLCCVVVDSRNQILVGDRGRGVVSVHENNGVHIRTLRLHNKPWCMAIGANDNVLVGDYIIGNVEVLTTEGHSILNIDPVFDGKRLKAAGVCADKDFIFISTHSTAPGFGGVLQYTKEGRLLGCIVSDLWNPLGMDFLPSDGSLIIADVTSIKKYLPEIPAKSKRTNIDRKGH